MLTKDTNKQISAFNFNEQAVINFKPEGDMEYVTIRLVRNTLRVIDYL